MRGGYTFATPLLREAAYAGVGKADLAERHARLARWAAGLSAPAPSLGWTAETSGRVRRRAGGAGDRASPTTVSLRPEAPARSVAPLGVAALGRLARRAIRAGEPGQSADYARARAASPVAARRAADRLVLVSALLQLGRTAEALGRRREGRGRRRRRRRRGEPGPGAHAGRARAPRARRRRTGRPGLGRVPRGRHRGQTSPPERAEVLRRIGMEEYRPRRLREAAEQLRGGAGHRRAVRTTGGPRRGRCRTWPGWPPRSGDFAAADDDADPRGPALRRDGRPRRPGLAARHHGVRPAAGGSAAGGPPAGQRVPAVRRAGRRAVGGRHAAGGRGVRRRRDRRTHHGRPGGPAGLPRVRRDRRRLGSGARAGRARAWSPAASASPTTPSTC